MLAFGRTLIYVVEIEIEISETVDRVGVWTKKSSRMKRTTIAVVVASSTLHRCVITMKGKSRCAFELHASVIVLQLAPASPTIRTT